MSRYRVAWAAQRDLDEIWYHIASFDIQAADRWLHAVEQKFMLLATQPHAGQARTDLAPDLRLLPVGSYLVFHRPLENGVEIARVIHGSRDYGPEFF